MPTQELHLVDCNDAAVSLQILATALPHDLDLLLLGNTRVPRDSLVKFGRKLSRRCRSLTHLYVWGPGMADDAAFQRALGNLPLQVLETGSEALRMNTAASLAAAA